MNGVPHVNHQSTNRPLMVSPTKFLRLVSRQLPIQRFHPQPNPYSPLTSAIFYSLYSIKKCMLVIGVSSLMFPVCGALVGWPSVQ